MTFKRCDLPTVAAHIIKRALMHRQQRDVRVLQDLTTCTVPAVTAAADASAAGTIQSEAYESADDLTDRFSNSSYQQSFPLQSSVFSLRQRRSKPDNRCRSASVRLQVNESHQYEISESQVWWHHQLQRYNL